MKIKYFKIIGVVCLICCFQNCKKRTAKEIVSEIKSRDNFQTRKALFFTDTTQASFANLLIKDKFFEKEITSEVLHFYKKNGYKTRWLYQEEPTELFSLYLEVLDKSANYGLNPQMYSRNELSEKVTKLYTNQAPSVLQIETLDRDITASFLLLTKHLGNGRLTKLGNKDYVWKRTIPQRDDVEILLKLEDDENLIEVIEALHPQHPLYKRMSQKYIDLQKDTIEIVQPFEFPDIKQFQYKYKDSTIRILRNNLKVRGYNAQAVFSEEEVDSVLIATISQFQKDKGIKPDGIPGKKTLYYLNMTYAQQRDLLLLNMERMRWLNNDLGENYILVNLPEFKLYMYEKDSIVFQTNVIVGGQYTATPIFIDTLKYVEFRPTWSVPQSIVRKEMIPKIIAEKDPLKYAKRGYRLFENDKEINPDSVDWQNPNVYRRALYFVEAPSERNSLGLVKFILTNDMSIYLHDTPSVQLFSRQERALSHGCIRIEKPAKFAYHLLKKQDDWTLQKVQQAMQNGKNQNRIRLKNKYLVDILYITAWVDEDNNLIVKNDIYGFDKQQLELLKKNL